MRGAQLRSSLAEVKRFGREIVASAIHGKETAHDLIEEPAAATETVQTNLIDALLTHIADHEVVADAAMNYLSAGSHRHPVLSNERAKKP